MEAAKKSSCKALESDSEALAAGQDTRENLKDNQYEILVPISVACFDERAEDGTCSRSNIECINWCQLDARTGETIMKRKSCKLIGDNEPNGLAKAIKQIDKSCPDKRCLFVTCGPLALRQHLHPAALRAKLELADQYDRYVDLTKEFCRRYGPLRSQQPLPWQRTDTGCESPAPTAAASGREQRPLPASYSAISCASSASSSSSAYASLDCNGSGALNECCATVGAHQDIQQQQQQHLAPYCYCCNYYQDQADYANQQEQQPGGYSHSQGMNPFYPMKSAEPRHQQEQGQNFDQCQQQQQVAAPTMIQPDGSTQFHNNNNLLQINEQQQQQPMDDGSFTRPSGAGLKLVGQYPAPGVCSQANRQADEMLKFLSIESESLWQNCEQLGKVEHELGANNCLKRHLDALESRKPNDDEPPKDNPMATSGGDNFQGNSESMVITPKVHCSACSILTSARLIDAMSLIVGRMINEGHQFNRFEGIKRRVEVGLCDESVRDNEQKVVRARGLPWQATEQDIADFFVGLNIARGGVGLCLSRQGRRNGEALIQFESREHRNLALSRHKHFMGTRYIEVYRANSEDFLNLASGYNNKAQPFLSRGAQVIVRMRGLPFTCTSKQVLDFFNNPNGKQKDTSAGQRCEVLGQEEGILFVKNQDDKPTGDAFVLFASEEFASRALQKHKQNIGSRYVELFRSTISEVQQVLSISSMEHGNGGGPNMDVNGANSPLIGSTPTTATTFGQRSNQATGSVASNGKQTARGQQASQSGWPRPLQGQVTYAQVATSNFNQTHAANGGAAQAPCDQQATSSKPVASPAQTDPSKADALASGEASRAMLSADKEHCSAAPSPNHEQASASFDSAAKACTVAPNALDTTTGGSSDSVSSEGSNSASSSSAFDNNSLNSSYDTSNSSVIAHGVGRGATSGRKSANSTNGTGSTDQLLLSSSSSTAQSPISVVSAASTGSSSYKSSQYSYQQRQNHNHQRSAHHHHHQSNHYNYRNNHSHYAHSQQHQYQATGGPHYNYHYQHHYQRGQQQPQYHQLHPMAAAYSQHQPQAGSQPHANHHLSLSPAVGPSHLAGYQPPAHLFPFYPPPPHLQPAAMAAPQLPAAYPADQVGQSVMVLPNAAGAPTAAPLGNIGTLYKRDCIRLRGLPFEAQVEDVLYFLGEQSNNIVCQGVHMVYSGQGQPTGEAIIQMNSSQTASAVAQEFHKKVMSVGKKQRYIEVIPCSIDDMNLVLGVGFVARRSLLATPPATPLLPGATTHLPYAAMGHHQHFRSPPLYAPHPVVSPASGCDPQPDQQQQQQSPMLADPSAAQQLDDLSPGRVAKPEVAPTADRGATAAGAVNEDDETESVETPPDSTTNGCNDGPAGNCDGGCAPNSINNIHGHNAKLMSAAVQPAEANLMPTTTAYYPILYYYPQQMLYQPHR